MLLESMTRELARVYLQQNGITGAFIWDNRPNGWTVYIGNPEDARGWVEQVFRTKRESKVYCDKLNSIISDLLSDK